MPITGQKIEIWRADTKILIVGITDGVTGLPFNMSGTSAMWWVARSYTSYEDEILIRKTSDDGSITITAFGVEIALSSDDTDIAANHYYHELKIFGGTDTSTAMTGEFIIMDSLDMVAPFEPAPPRMVLTQGAYQIPVKYATYRYGIYGEGPPLRPLQTIGY